jgi:hypothetical protein
LLIAVNHSNRYTSESIRISEQEKRPFAVKSSRAGGISFIEDFRHMTEESPHTSECVRKRQQES